MTDNPFFEPWTTPFEAPPFTAIVPEHFGPAFERAMAEHQAEIDAIAADPRTPDFDNVIGALELSGRSLQRVGGVFWNLSGADTNDDLQEIERNMSPVLARHYQAIGLNQALFARIDALFGRIDALGLDAEQRRVLDLTHKSFVRSGAKLDPAGRTRLAEVSERLAVLGTRFSQNVLADEKSFLMMLESEEDLAGLPPALRDAAAQAAAERGLPGHHAITLGRSLIEPFLRFSSRRDLREKAFEAWLARGENEGPHDNRPVVSEIIGLRAERAALLGFDTFADFKLEDAGRRPRPPGAGLGEGQDQGGPRGGGPAGRDRPRGRQFRAGAVRLALLCREGAQGPIRARRDGDQILPGARRCRGRGLRYGEPAVRPVLPGAGRRAGLSPRRARL